MIESKTMRKRRRLDIEEAINAAIYKSIKAVHKNEIIGYIAWRNGNYIAQLYVNSEYQGMGIGKELIGQMLSASDTTAVELKSSTNAVGFYKKLGFVASGDEQSKDGVCYVPMVLNNLPFT